jgi:hypothetical protein
MWGRAFAGLFLAGILLPLAAQQNAPAWYLEKDLDFPDSDYISAIGNGSSEDAAKSQALAQVSLFFKTSVDYQNDTISNYNRPVQTANRQVTGNTQMREHIQITSQEEFLAVRFAPSYYDGRGKTWYACCYINKAEARNIYAARIQSSQALFTTLAAAAKNESELLYAGNQLQKAITVGRLIEADIQSLAVVGGRAEGYASLIQSLKAVQQDYDALRSSITFAVRLEGDRQRKVTTALSQALEGMGYKTSPNRPAYTLWGELTFEETVLPAMPYNVTAGIELELRDAKGAPLFSYHKNYSRAGHRASWEAAYNAAIREIEADLREQFVTEFTSFLNE